MIYPLAIKHGLLENHGKSIIYFDDFSQKENLYGSWTFPGFSYGFSELIPALKLHLAGEFRDFPSKLP
jgi:hypothetical protein